MLRDGITAKQRLENETRRNYNVQKISAFLVLGGGMVFTAVIQLMKLF